MFIINVMYKYNIIVFSYNCYKFITFNVRICLEQNTTQQFLPTRFLISISNFAIR